MDYYVVTAASYDNERECADMLAQKVAELLAQGWKLQGGVSITRSDLSNRFERFEYITMAQAMVME